MISSAWNRDERDLFGAETMVVWIWDNALEWKVWYCISNYKGTDQHDMLHILLRVKGSAVSSKPDYKFSRATRPPA